MGLSAKHQRFADLVLGGMGASAAYREAGYEARGDAEHTGASRLLAKPEVAGYIGAVRDKDTSEAVATLIEAKEILSEHARNGKLAPKDRRMAIDSLAKLSGWHAPESHEHEHGVSDPIAELIAMVRK